MMFKYSIINSTVPLDYELYTEVIRLRDILHTHPIRGRSHDKTITTQAPTQTYNTFYSKCIKTFSLNC